MRRGRQIARRWNVNAGRGVCGDVELGVLGPVQASLDGRAVNLGVRRQRLVLAVLALEANHLVSTGRLIALSWPDRPPASARGMIHSQVSGLRTILSNTGAARHGVALLREGTGYVLRCDRLCVDAHRFTDLLTRARAAADTQRVALFDEALALWRGPALAGTADEEIRDRLCRSLEDARLGALEDRADARLRLGAHQALLSELAPLVGRHPHRQRFTGQLMLALYRTGRTAEALATYERARRRFAEEFGIEPTAELRALHMAILRDDPALAPRAPLVTGGHAGSEKGTADTRGTPGATNAADPRAGTVGADEAVERGPALLPRPAQLPPDLHSFTGRDREVARLLAAQPSGEDSGPVTITISAVDGMAGVGKTTLAVHVAHRLAPHYPDGQLFVDLHGFTEDIDPVDPSDALDRLLRALGVAGEQIPPSLDERSALLRSHLADRRMLLLLDNAADEAQVAPLLPGTAGCLVLITSRRRLVGIDDVQAVPVDVLTRSDAVALFARVAGTDADTTDTGTGAGSGEDVDGAAGAMLVAVELCGRLPLAIRIAAARLRSRPSWTVEYLAGRLRAGQHGLAELKSGRRSVAAAFQVSYDHLGPEQRQLFRRLGLHPGPDVDAAAAAALLELPPHTAGRLLDELADVHLVEEPAAGRYRLHDLLRTFAVQCAHAQDAEPVRRAAVGRLIDHYVSASAAAVALLEPREAPARDAQPGAADGIDVPEPATPARRFGTAGQAADWLDTERVTLLAVASHAAEHGWPAHASALSSILGSHLDRRAFYTDALTLHGAALRAADRHGDAAGSGWANYHLGVVHLRLGNNSEALGHLTRARTALHAIGDEAGEARALDSLGVLCRMLARFTESVDHLSAALVLFHRIGDRAHGARAAGNLALVHQRLGRYDEALAYHRQGLDLFRELGDRGGEGYALYSLGLVYLRMGRHDDAGPVLRSARSVFAETGDRVGESYVLAELGVVHRLLGQPAQALSLLRTALARSQETGERNAEIETRLHLGDTLRLSGVLGEGLAHYRTALTMATDLHQLDDQARAHDGLAHTYQELGETGRARTHWTAALDLYTQAGVPEAEQIRHRLGQGTPAER